LVNQESLAYLEQKVEMADQELLDLKGHKVIKEILVQMVHQVHLGMMASMGKGDHLVQRERKGNLAFKVDQDPEAHLELRDQKAILEPLDFLAILESKDLEVSKESLVILATMEEKETEEFRATLDLQVNLACKGLLENLVCQDLLASKVMLVHLALKETLAPWDLLACKGLLVIKVHLGLRVLLV